MATIILSSSRERAFWERTKRNTETGCLEWIGARSSYGYGAMRVSGAQLKTHRIAWVLAHGQIPDGLLICHRCDNPPCVEKDHLFAGTASDNSRDMVNKGRARPRRGDRHGMRLHPERAPAGERNGNARLTDDVVRSIRARVAAGESQRAVARAIGVWQQTISLIVRRKRWAHLT